MSKLAALEKYVENVKDELSKGDSLLTVDYKDGKFYLGDNVFEFTPTVRKYIESDKRAVFLMGAIGSGKSTASVIKILKCGLDGARREQSDLTHRWVISRSTYQQLITNTMITFDKICNKIVTYRTRDVLRNLLHIVQFVTPEGFKVTIRIEFISIDTDLGKLDGLEINGAWFNEGQLFSQDAFDKIMGRQGRFAEDMNVEHVDKFMIVDYNAPSIDHWLYYLAEELKPVEYDFFRQPPALIKMENGTYIMNPMAEFMYPVNEAYYKEKVISSSEGYIKVFVLNEYSYQRFGQSVYKSFNENLHVKHHFYDPKYGVVIGFDFGRTPACAIGQVINGQLRIVKEITLFDQTLTYLLDKELMPWLNETGAKVIWSSVDPSGVKRDEYFNDFNAITILNKYRLNAKVPYTNDPDARIIAVEDLLNRLVNGQPALQIDPACKMLIRGMAKDYVYSDKEEKKIKIIKNDVSHICDALQYLVLVHSAQSKHSSGEPFKPLMFDLGNQLLS